MSVVSEIESLGARITANEKAVRDLKAAVLALHDYVMGVVDQLAIDLPGSYLGPEMVTIALPPNPPQGKAPPQSRELTYQVPKFVRYPAHDKDPNHAACHAAIQALDPEHSHT